MKQGVDQFDLFLACMSGYVSILENNICALAELDEKETLIQLVMNLSSFYRSSLSNGKMHISIGQELEISRAYLEILQIRYFHKFDFTITCPEALKNYSCIKLLLQPILENSIYHGIKGLDRHGILHIEAEDAGDCIRFTISDNGRGIFKRRLRKNLAAGCRPLRNQKYPAANFALLRTGLWTIYGKSPNRRLHHRDHITQTGGIAMSLKLLIADDEYFIRQRIKKDHTLGKTKSYFCRRSRKRTAGHRPSGKTNP